MSPKKYFIIRKFLPKLYLHLSMNFYWLFLMEVKTLSVCFFFYEKMVKKVKKTETNKNFKKKKKNFIDLEKFLKKKIKNQKMVERFQKLIKNESLHQKWEKTFFYSLWSNFGKKSLELKKFKKVYRKKLGLNFVKKQNGVFLIFGPQFLDKKKEGQVFDLTKEKNGKWLKIFPSKIY